MNRDAHLSRYPCAFPHTCGGGPRKIVVGERLRRFSPQTWGRTEETNCWSASLAISSRHVGRRVRPLPRACVSHVWRDRTTGSPLRRGPCETVSGGLGESGKRGRSALPLTYPSVIARSREETGGLLQSGCLGPLVPLPSLQARTPAQRRLDAFHQANPELSAPAEFRRAIQQIKQPSVSPGIALS